MEDQIVKLDCKKHVKIWKLHLLGLPRKRIAELLETNSGHIGNVLKEYKESPEKVEAANSLTVPVQS